MTLKGDLDSISLADVFQTLSMTQQEGTLFVQDQHSRKAIFFTREGVRLMTSAEKKGGKLGDMLVGMGKITREQLEQALTTHREQGNKLGETMIQLGFVTVKDIDAAVKVQIEEEIYDLFSWEGATFEFVEGEPPDGTFDTDSSNVTQLTFNVNSLIMEAARRIDEWDLIEKVMPTQREIFVPAKRLQPTEFTEKERTILRLVDGKHSVRDIVDDSLVPRFEVCKFLYRLFEDGKIQRAPFESLLEFGDEAVRTENLEEAAKFYEQAIASKAKKKSDMNKARMRYAQALEFLDRKKEAADQYKLLADSKVEDKDLEGAINIWQKVIDLNPLDLENKERLINVYIEHREHFDPSRSDVIRSVEYSLFKNGKSLAMAFAYAGQIDRAKEVLINLLEISPNNADLRKALANILFDAGEKAEAIENLEKIATFLLANKDFAELLEIYKKILKIDAARNDIRKKIQMIEAGEVKSVSAPSRGFGRILVVIAAVILVVGAAAAAGYYQYKANETWKAAESEAGQMWSRSVEVDVHKDEKARLRAEARGKVQSVIDGYPWSTPLSKARKLLARWQQEEEDEREQAETLLRAQSTALNAVRGRMDGLLAEKSELDVQKVVEEIDKAVRDARDNPYASDDLAALAALRQAFIDKRTAVENILVAARAAEEKSQASDNPAEGLREAWLAWANLYKNGRRFPDLWNQVAFPVLIQTDPPAARVYVNREGPSKAPLMLRQAPGQALDVQVTMRGYKNRDIKIAAIDIERLTPELARNLCFRRVTLDIQALCEPLHVDLDGEKMQSDPVASGDSVFVAIEFGRVTSFRLDDDAAKQEWIFFRPSFNKLRGGFMSRLAVSSLNVFLPCEDGVVYRASLHGAAPSVESLFRYDTSSSGAVHSIREMAGVALSQDEKFLVVGTDRGVTAFDVASGKVAWQFPLDDGNAAWAVPACHDGMAYAGTDSGDILAFELSAPGPEAKPKWRRAVGSQSPVRSALAVRDGILYAGCENGNLVALDLSRIEAGAGEGAERNVRYLNAPIRCHPQFIGGRVVVTAGALLHVLEPKTLNPDWKFEVGGRSGAATAPSVFGNSVFVANEDGILFSLDVLARKVNWERQVPGRVRKRPAVSQNGTVFIVSEEKKGITIVAYKE